jgi:hypothetical protein
MIMNQTIQLECFLISFSETYSLNILVSKQMLQSVEVEIYFLRLKFIKKL